MNPAPTLLRLATNFASLRFAMSAVPRGIPHDFRLARRVSGLIFMFRCVGG
jgi:hypothetical protein